MASMDEAGVREALKAAAQQRHDAEAEARVEAKQSPSSDVRGV